MLHKIQNFKIVQYSMEKGKSDSRAPPKQEKGANPNVDKRSNADAGNQTSSHGPFSSHSDFLSFIEAQIKKCLRNQILQSSTSTGVGTDEVKVTNDVSELFESLVDEAKSDTGSLKSFASDDLAVRSSLGLGLQHGTPSMKTFDYLPAKYETISQTGFPVPKDGGVPLSDLSIRANASSASDLSSLTSIGTSLEPSRTGSPICTEVFSIKKYWTANEENLQRTFGVPAHMFAHLWKKQEQPSVKKQIVRPWSEKLQQESSVRWQRRKAKLPEHFLRKSVPDVCLIVSQEELHSEPEKTGAITSSSAEKSASENDKCDETLQDNNNNADVLGNPEVLFMGTVKEQSHGHVRFSMDHDKNYAECLDNSGALSLLPLGWYKLDDNSNQSLDNEQVKFPSVKCYVESLAKRIEYESDWRNDWAEQHRKQRIKSAHAKLIQKYLVKLRKKQLHSSASNQNGELHCDHLASVAISPKEFDSEERILVTQVEEILAKQRSHTVGTPDDETNSVKQMNDMVLSTPKPDIKKHLLPGQPVGTSAETRVSEVFRKYHFDQTPSTVATGSLVNSENIWTTIMSKTFKHRTPKHHSMTAGNRQRETKARIKESGQTKNPPDQGNLALAPRFDFVVGPSPRSRKATWAQKLIPNWFRKARSTPTKSDEPPSCTDQIKQIQKGTVQSISISQGKGSDRKNLWDPRNPADKIQYKSYYGEKGRKPTKGMKNNAESIVTNWNWKMTQQEQSRFLRSTTSKSFTNFLQCGYKS